DSTIRVVGPCLAADAVIVGVIAERQPRRLPAMREVLGEVKRRADAEQRRLADDTERRAFYAANRERWRGPRVRLTRITMPAADAAEPMRRIAAGLRTTRDARALARANGA